jgi:hypothetical protein
MKEYYYQDELYIIEKMEIWEEDWYFLCQYTVENGEIKKGYTIHANTDINCIYQAMNVHDMYLRTKERDS